MRLIEEAARRFGIPPAWVRGVMRIESGGRTMLDGRPITSPAGAMGLMQVMPATFAELSGRYGLGSDPYDPRANILAGTAYLREMYDRFGATHFLAAYNAGPGRVDEHLRTGRPLPGETQRYVQALGPELAGDRTIDSSVAPNGRARSDEFGRTPRSCAVSFPATVGPVPARARPSPFLPRRAQHRGQPVGSRHSSQTTRCSSASHARIVEQKVAV